VHAQRVPCASCHVVPAAYDSPGHIDGDGKAELVFGGLAIARGATPRFENGRCSGTYCHGATLAGGSNPAPSWTDGPGAVACGTCHAVPLSGHYGGASCHFCHGAVVDASRRILRPDLHPDGVVQAVDLSAECSACHGPPQDLGGAHAAHLAGANGRAVGCGECHRVPAEVAAPGHLDDTPGAEIAFGPLARTGRSAPAWDRAQQRCSGTYCHGATLRGGANRAPAWSGGPGEAPCGACHGVPMPNHYGERCSDCHGAVVDRGGRIVRPDLHVNGRIDFAEVP
jgi:predicted CxxxxCH...CXXCH cytochrome family protein